MASADPRAKIISSLLDRHGLSMRWLATKIDGTHVSVSKWLNGDATPRDRNVWNQMIEVLRDYERSGREGDSVELKRTGLRQILVYPGLSAGVFNQAQGVDVDAITIPDWGSDRERWGRRIEGFSMSPLLEPGDIAVFENRAWESGHVVHAYLAADDTDTVKVAKGRQGHDEVQLLPVNEDFSWVSVVNVEVKGVCVMRIRMGPDGEKTTTEYPYGMRFRA